MTPSISVICPVWSMEGRLQNLQSWLSECSSHFQVILVCDSSGDRTLEELQEIKESLPSVEIEIIDGLYGSPGSARNAGLKRANKEWVVFWDSDDIGKPRELVEALSSSHEDLPDAFVFGYEVYSKDTKKITWPSWPKSEGECIEDLALNPGIWRFCFKRTSLVNIAFHSLRMAEDQLFVNDFLRKSLSIVFSDTVTYKYFVGIANQLTGNKKALRDLRVASGVLSQFAIANVAAEVFTLRIHERILITQIKKGGLIAKFQATIKLATLAFRFPTKTLHLLGDIAAKKIN